MGIAPFSITLDRKKVVDFTEIYAEEPNAILIPPPMEDSRLLAFTKPFHSLVWLGLFLVMILVPSSLWMLTKIIDRRYRQSFINQQNYSSPFSLNRVSIMEQFQSVYAVLVSQRKLYNKKMNYFNTNHYR